MMRTLPREPWRGSQICGWQVAFGDWTHGAAWCGEQKGMGLHYCPAHHIQARDEYGPAYLAAEGNALGATWQALRLLWEPADGDIPIEASFAEMAEHAAGMDAPGGER